MDQGNNENKIINIKSESDIINVRRTVRDVSTSIGFGVTDVTRIVTASSELTRNILLYADKGVMLWSVLSESDNNGIELVFKDTGPGIANLDKAMEMGYSTSKGLGLGLPGTKKLMDEMEISASVDCETLMYTLTL